MVRTESLSRRVVSKLSFDAPENPNYAAVIVQVPQPVTLEGLDNLVGVPLFGYQALTQKDGIKQGDLRVMFTAETQLDPEYARNNNLYRDAGLNADLDETGYLENNGRIKAIRLRKQASNALLMPLESLAYTGYDVSTLKVGDTFDALNGHQICRKYAVPSRGRHGEPKPKVQQRVDQKLFPMHLDTEHLFRNLHVFREPQRVVVTQKLHGTSARFGRVPVRRDKGWLERVVVNKWLGIATPDTEYADVAGSRRVIKGKATDDHYYDRDVWSEFGKRLEGMIPDGFVVYGELIGWVDEQTPIQKGYTYNLAPGQVEFYVYRVATVNHKGVIADLSWQGVKQFCASLGLNHAPEIDHFTEWLPSGEFDADFVTGYTEDYLDRRLAEELLDRRELLPLSDPKSVDEGICVRIEGMIPAIYKAKSPLFLEYETKSLDKGDVDLESVA